MSRIVDLQNVMTAGTARSASWGEVPGSRRVLRRRVRGGSVREWIHAAERTSFRFLLEEPDLYGEDDGEPV
jgi:hypothetical protein